MKRGRPKGKSTDQRSFGPLGDLIRKCRIENGLGLADLAEACDCSVQFISNIEHGRAPLPWYKLPELAKALGLAPENLEVANFTARSDFKNFVKLQGGAKGKKVVKPNMLRQISEAVAIAAKDDQLSEVIALYHASSHQSKKKFLRTAFEMLGSTPANMRE
jgi:transcriptional regulator with XRE-family HTH domain